MKRVLVILLGIALLAGGAYAGYAYRVQERITDEQTQMGWCCVPSEGACIAVEGTEACRAKDGTVFNWDSGLCASFCLQ